MSTAAGFGHISTYDRAVQTQIRSVGLHLQHAVSYLLHYSDIHKINIYEICNFLYTRDRAPLDVKIIYI
jgi:hypothetical protein